MCPGRRPDNPALEERLKESMASLTSAPVNSGIRSRRSSRLEVSNVQELRGCSPLITHHCEEVFSGLEGRIT